MEAMPITNCSATLPSLNRRVLPSKVVCRNLFGSVDHEEISSILESELHRDLKEKNEEWCFNFSDGTPLRQGRLVWEEIKQRNEDELSTVSKKSTCKESRVPELHSEIEHSGNDVLEITKNMQLESEAVTTTQSQKLPTSETEILVSDCKVFPLVDRKRKRQCRTITGIFLLLCVTYLYALYHILHA